METFNRNRLFLGSCIALITTAMTFAIRARLELAFGPEGVGLTLEQIGYAFGPAFWGFTAAMVIGGPLVDSLGLKRIVWGAFVMHLIGIIVTLFATDMWSLFAGTLFIGLGNGLVEAACNPMIASIYPRQKTKMLNRFHIWFPGGIVIGSIVAYLIMDVLGLSWQVMVASLFVPLVIYAIIFLGQQFPVTERVEMGISNADMWKSIGTPLFLFMGFCMLLTAATELGTNQRIASLLEGNGANALLILALTNGVMAVGRAFGGDFAHRLSITGMLIFSAIFSALGLWWLSVASGATAYLAAILFGVGICFFWPMMLSFVAEHIPQSGALGLSVMGGLGMLSVSIVLPIIGRILDNNTTGMHPLQIIAFIPIILTVLFTGLYIYMRSRGALVKADVTPVD